MPISEDAGWFAARTAAAPELLRARAEEYFRQTRAESGVARLEVAGARALEAAIDAGQNRAAALDLLAADALITLALLAQAEDEPATLGLLARGLRLRAIA
jgi:hypothetical protein